MSTETAKQALRKKDVKVDHQATALQVVVKKSAAEQKVMHQATQQQSNATSVPKSDPAQASVTAEQTTSGNEQRKNKEKNSVSEHEFQEVVIDIRRVVKVTKGGRNFRFAAVVVIGDGAHAVGLGTARAREVPNAIKKAIANAQKNLIHVSIVKDTIPYSVTGRHGAARVLLMPASAGNGITAGGAVRSIIELSGIKNIRSKKIGSGNPINILRATINGLQQLVSLETTLQARLASLAAKKAPSHEQEVHK